jgi:hypothetical protein
LSQSVWRRASLGGNHIFSHYRLSIPSFDCPSLTRSATKCEKKLLRWRKVGKHESIPHNPEGLTNSFVSQIKWIEIEEHNKESMITVRRKHVITSLEDGIKEVEASIQASPPTLLSSSQTMLLSGFIAFLFPSNYYLISTTGLFLAL